MIHEIGKSYIEYSQDSMNSSELCIDNVYVDIECRGQGIGKELVEYVVNYALNEDQYQTVGLYAEPQTDDGLSTDALIAFYESCGFEQDGDFAQLMSQKV